MKIIFVCSGNTCRSPMAECVFKQMLKDEGIKDVEVESRGVVANVGADISENAKKAFANTTMFHGVIYNTRMILKHYDVGLIFYALYLSKYAYSILNNKAYALEQEITIDDMY